jgi:CDP-diacylglycerol---serine O-phosphatidyltransferase
MLRTNDKINWFNIPCIVSFFALFLSFISIIQLLNNHFYVSFSLILFAFILDAFDGMLARRMHLESDFGRYLDSHVDVFIYLIYPSFVYLYYFNLGGYFALAVIFIYLASGIFRLARFTLQGFITTPETNSRAYTGLPVYFNHFPILILLLLRQYEMPYFKYIAYAVIILNSVLLISKIKVPKPKSIFLYAILLFIVACLMLWIGVYAKS